MEKPGSEFSGPAFAPPRSRTLRVWDLPTRLFHWLLAVLVVMSFVTAGIGGNAMRYHEWCGEAILALLMFRVAWGFIGSSPSRFRTFLAGPATVFRYVLTLFRREADHHLSHNPLGGWSVMAMLLVLLIQAGTGLFANDDIATEGPLYKWVSKAASDRLTVHPSPEPRRHHHSGRRPRRRGAVPPDLQKRKPDHCR